MTDKLCERLSAFHHKTLQRVLGINMFAVDRGRIKNEHLRNKLSVCNTADMIQLHWKTCTHAIKSIAKPKPSGLQAAAGTCAATLQELAISLTGSTSQNRKRTGTGLEMIAFLMLEKSVPDLALVCQVLQPTVNGQ